MRSIQRQFLRRLFGRQVTAVWLLFAVVASQAPLISFAPSNPEAKDHSRPFPCQDRPCGCRTAEQCRKRCCCFTNQQKLAWAKQHGVKESDVVLAATETDITVRKSSCCSKSRMATSRLTDRLTHSELMPKKGARSHYVMIAKALECQGVDQTFFGQLIFVVPSKLSQSTPIQSAGKRLYVPQSRWSDLNPEPPVPPPRLLNA